ncbi:MAG TPA: hypothetical protein VI728_11905, partial [Syntrophales bacterium]|nr:hypothetical protein [Syntrophales bacterium]
MTHPEGWIFRDIYHPVFTDIDHRVFTDIDHPGAHRKEEVACLVQRTLKEAGQERMARRRVTVRDAEEILAHWQGGRSIRSIAGSLGASRPTIRKYVVIAED